MEWNGSISVCVSKTSLESQRVAISWSRFFFFQFSGNVVIVFSFIDLNFSTDMKTGLLEECDFQ
jgi:hypothetical protein